MPEEVNEEVQEEEITLTEDDLAVIDEVEATDEEPQEIEQSDSVESEPEPVVDDEPSIDDDVSGQTFNPDLVARAQQYGLDPNGFANEEQLNYVVDQFNQGNDQLYQWQNWYQNQLQTQQPQTAEQYKTQQPQFRVDLSEDYDEGLRTAIDQMAAQMQSYYDQQLDVVARSILDQQDRIAYQQQYVSQAEAYQQQQHAASELDQFNNAVSRLDNQALFGDASYQELEPGSQQAQNMERLFDQVNVLAAGYEAQGLLVPQQDELVKQAYHTVFGEQISNQHRQRFNDRARRNSRRRLGSGATTAAQPELADDVDELVNSEVLKEFYDSAISDNGS